MFDCLYPLICNIQLTMGKDWRRLLPSHLDLHLEIFVLKKKEIAENITTGSGNLKTQNLRTSGSGVSPNPHQRTSGFHKRLESFPGSYSTCSKQRDHPRPYTHRLFDHHSYISKPDNFFLDNHGYQHDAQRGFGLICDTRPTLVTTYWKQWFAVSASPPSSLGSTGPVTKWNWPGYQPVTLHSIYSTVVGLRSLLLLPLLKKEIAAATGGWGVTEYLQLDWMDDETNGWMESFRTSFNILGVLFQQCLVHVLVFLKKLSFLFLWVFCFFYYFL